MKEHIDLIDCLSAEWKTTAQLSRETGLSEKTIRNRIKRLNEELYGSGASIESKTNRGFRLVVLDNSSYEDCKKKNYLHNKIHPEDHDERCHYILDKLLFKHRDIKRSELADALYVSEKTISNDMKDIMKILSEYELEIKSIPNYGYRVIGNEFKIRQCLLNCVVSPMDQKDLNVQKVVTKIVHDTISENGMAIPEYLMNAIIDYLAISTKRIREGILIQDDTVKKWDKHVGIYYVSIYIMESMVSEGLIPAINDAEVFYVSLYLWGNRIMRKQSSNLNNYVIPSHVSKIAIEMESFLKKHFHLELNEEYRKCFTIHTVAVEIRGKYNIVISNPYRDLVKEEYVYAYYIARRFVKPLEKYLNKKLSDDEITLYAMLIHSLIPIRNYKVSTVFVYDKERVEDHAIYCRIETYLSDLISINKTCEPDELSYIDKNSYDLILSVQPIPSIEDKHVIKIGYEKIMSNFDEIRGEIEELRKKIQEQFLEEKLHLKNKNSRVVEVK